MEQHLLDSTGLIIASCGAVSSLLHRIVLHGTQSLKRLPRSANKFSHNSNELTVNSLLYESLRTHVRTRAPQKWRKAQYDLEMMRKQLGKIQKEIGAKMKAKESVEAEKTAKAVVETEITALEAEAGSLLTARDKALDLVPNELDADVPVSNDEADNRVVRAWGDLRPSTPDLHHHHELLTMIDGYEPERGVGVAGHRGYFLKGVGLLLNQAIINYALSFLMSREYVPLQPPFFMNKEVMAAVAQLSDFDEQLYKVSGSGEGDDDKYLIATSEQPICAYHRGEWLPEKELPKRYAGFSSCFRKEAGSHGRDTWGIFRVHQFEKVEQFVVCEPEHSAGHQEAMITACEEFYKSLGIGFRTVCIVSGELNNAATKKYDLEGWFPGFDTYRELVSCSNCTDYQARAMEVRCGVNKKGDGSKKYVHFLNSTLCATGRTICAILENYQTPEGVKVPDVLVPYMGGRTFMPFTREKPINSDEAKASAKAAKAEQKHPEKAGYATLPSPTPAETAASTAALQVREPCVWCVCVCVCMCARLRVKYLFVSTRYARCMECRANCSRARVRIITRSVQPYRCARPCVVKRLEERLSGLHSFLGGPSPSAEDRVTAHLLSLGLGLPGYHGHGGGVRHSPPGQEGALRFEFAPTSFLPQRVCAEFPAVARWLQCVRAQPAGDVDKWV